MHLSNSSFSTPKIFPLLLFVGMLLGLSFLQAREFVVTTLADTVALDGEISLREALNAANANAPSGDAPAGDPGQDIIAFSPKITGGTIPLTAPLVITEDADLRDDLAQRITLDGGGTLRILEIAPGITSEVTGLLLANGFDATAGGAVFVGTGGTLTLDHVDVSTSEAADGGGVFNTGGNLTVLGSSFDFNRATGTPGSGGAIFNAAGGTLDVSDTTFTGNTANRAGGAIEDQAGVGLTTIITRVDFSNNQAGVPVAGPGNGGAIHITGPSDMVIQDGLVDGNFAAREGGGFWNGSGTMTVNRTIFTNNEAAGVGANDGGGALFNNGGTLVVNDALLDGNTATGTAGSGGGLFSTGGAVTLTDTRILNNTSMRAGGGIEVVDGLMNLVDVELSFNTTASAPGNGGGLHVTGTNGTVVTITDGRVEGNTAAREGGGLWGQRGSILNVTGTDILGNIAQGAAADDGGGGLFNNGGTMTIIDAMILNNSATGAGGSGGGLQNIAGGVVTISGTRFEANVSMRAGGAIEDNAGGSITITDSDLVGNTTGNSPGNGGGIHITGPGTVSITDSDVSRNVAGNEGGGLWNSGAGTMNITDTSVAFNNAPDGGGLFAQAGAGNMTVVNSTIGLNTADNGAGVQIEGGTNTFLHVTIASNTAAVVGGGFNVTAGIVNLANSLIGDNAAGTAPDYNGAITTSIGLFLEDTTGATGPVVAPGNVLGQDPQLMSYARTGDRTRTFLPMAGSPALDAANAGAAAIVPLDQRNTARVAATADIGSVERQPLAETQIDVTTFADVVNAADGVTSLREAIIMANGIAGPNIIGLQNGTYALAIAGIGEDAAATGDLDLTDEILLTGVGRGFSMIDAAGLDRGLHLIGVPAELEEFDIVNGLADNGGGLENSAGTLDAFRVAFTDNTANGLPGSGGGLRNDVGGSINLEQVVFFNNTANRAGGGIEDISGTAANTLLDVDFFNNNAGVAPATAAPGNGGAIHISGAGDMDITGGLVNGNVAAAEGGGFWNSIGTMTVTDTSFIGNDAQGAPADQGGGALFNNGGTLNLIDVLATFNAASGAAGSGGVLLSTNGLVTIVNSRLLASNASRAGGAIELIEGTLSLDDSELAFNSTGPAPGNGGGIHITGGANATINDSLINDNIASREGGGLWNGRGTMTVQGMTIIARNDAQGPAADDGGGGLFNNGGTLVLTGTDVVVRDNTALGASGSGGGIFNNTGGTLTVTGSLIEANEASRAGGGIEDQSGPGLGITLDGAILDANITGAAPGNGGGLHITGPGDSLIDGGTIARYNTASAEGGGLWNGTGTMTIGLAEIFGNTASGDPADQGGGGVFNAGGIINFTDPNWSVRGNVADGASGSGGGILNDGGTIDLVDGFVDYNLASRAGGGVEGTAAAGPITLTGTQLNGNQTGAAPGNGGALHVTGVGPVSATDVTVIGNCAAAEGGGFWNNQGLMTIADSTFLLNDGQGASASNGGGGLFNNGGTLDVDNTLIASNVASGASGSGGGLLSVGGTVTLDMVQILTNTANRAGGGIEVIDGNLSITDSVLNENVAGPAGSAAPGNGGGIHVSGMNGGLVTVTRTDVKRNFAAREGGGLWSQAGSTMIVEDGTCLKGNLAAGPAANDGGGALFNNGGILIIDGSANPILICSNAATGAAGQGGGLLSVGGTVTIDDATLSDNTASGPGADTTAINGAKISPQFNYTSEDTLFDATSAYGQDFVGQNGGTDYDQLTATGPVDLGGSMLMITADPSFVPSIGTTYTLIDKSGAATVTGTYAGLPEGAAVIVNGVAMKISYVGNDGNDVILTACPPPTFANCTPETLLLSVCASPADFPLPESVLQTATSGCNVVTAYVETVSLISGGSLVQTETFFVEDDCGLTGTCQRVFVLPLDTQPPNFAGCGAGCVSDDGPVTLSAMADGSQEVPPVTNAFNGTGSFSYDAASGMISWTIVHSVTNASAAHIHGPAGPGMNAGVIVNLGPAASPIVGSAAVSATDAATILSGMAYLNIHSPVFPAGAIRGQIIPDTACLIAMATPDQEVPPVTNAFSGTGLFYYDAATSNLSWSITHSVTNATSAHIHGPAGVGTNAPVLVNLGPATSPIVGSATISQADALTIIGGLAYLNIHSPDFPAGAIRGQLTANTQAGNEMVMLDGCNPILPDVADVLNSASDNCGLATVTFTETTATNGTMTTVTRVFTATDVNGNTGTCTRVFSFEPDTEAPTFACAPGVVTLMAMADGSQEVPPATNDFSGMATFTYDASVGTISWSITHNVTNATAAHIHGPAGPGMNAGVLVNLGPAASPITGSATISAADAATILSGMAYLNIHSPVFPAGAIRGQIQPKPTTFAVSASGAQEVPPAMNGFSASALFNYDPVAGTISWDITHDVANASAAHIHAPAGPNANAGVLINLGPAASPIVGSAAIAPADAADLLAGMAYLNIHSPAFPAGAVRGQLTVATDLGCSGTPPDAADLLATAADNCGVANASVDEMMIPDGCDTIIVRTFLATDNAGNTGTCVQAYTTRSDSEPPVFGAMASIDLGCNPDVDLPSIADVFATLSDNCGLVSSSVVESTMLDGCQVTIMRDFNAVDACGNTGSLMQVITLTNDTTPPDFNGCDLSTMDLGCNPETIPPALDPMACAMDNCGVASTMVSETLTTGTVTAARAPQDCRVTLTRTYTAVDNCGNTGTAQQVFTWLEDDTPPDLTACGIMDMDLGCNPADIPDPVALTDCIVEACGVVMVDFSSTTNLVGCSVAIVRVYTLTDQCGNVSATTQTISFLNDTTPPDFNSCDLATMDLGCNPDTIPDPLDPADCAMDNCGVVTAMVSETMTTGTLAAARAPEDCRVTLTRTYTAVDSCGNTGTAQQVFTWVEDTTAPDLSACAIMDVMLGCNPETIPGPVDLSNCVAEACGTVMLEISATTNTADCLRTMVRTYTVVDGCGNMASTNQTIIWTMDDTAPDLAACGLVDMDLGRNPVLIPGAVNVAACAVDDCDGVLTGSVEEAMTSVGCNRTITRTYSVMDACGNSTSLVQTLTYTVQEDGPSITCPADLSVPSVSGPTCQAPVPSIAATATDACGVTLAVTQVPAVGGTLSGPGPHTVTVTTTDDLGRSASCSVMVSVQCIEAIVVLKTVVKGTDCSQATASIEASPGDQLTYCFSVENSGQTSFTDVRVSDLLVTPAVSDQLVASFIGPGQSTTFQLPHTFQGGLTNVAELSYTSSNGGTRSQVSSSAAIANRGTAKIRGWLYLDLANSGDTDGMNITNLGLENIRVLLFQNGVQIDSTTSGSGSDIGMYEFCDLLAGSYEVRLDLDSVPDNLRDQVDRTSAGVTLSIGELADNVDFAFTPAPTAVTLERFSSQLGPDGLTLTWTTAFEDNSLGFLLRVNGEQVGNLLLAEGGGDYRFGPVAVQSGDTVDVIELDNNLAETALQELVVLPPQEDATADIVAASDLPLRAADTVRNVLLTELPGTTAPSVGGRKAVGVTLDEPGTLYLGLPAGAELSLR